MGRAGARAGLVEDYVEVNEAISRARVPASAGSAAGSGRVNTDGSGDEKRGPDLGRCRRRPSVGFLVCEVGQDVALGAFGSDRKHALDALGVLWVEQSEIAEERVDRASLLLRVARLLPRSSSRWSRKALIRVASRSSMVRLLGRVPVRWAVRRLAALPHEPRHADRPVVALFRPSGYDDRSASAAPSRDPASSE